MKRIYLTLLLLLVSISLVFSQDKEIKRNEVKSFNKQKKYYETVFGQKDPAFDIFSASAQYKEEPIVILAQKKYYGFFKADDSNDECRVRMIERKRVLIQDIAAISNFSEFYFQGGMAFGIEHIKPDGKRAFIDLSDAFKVSSDIPRFYRKRYSFDDYYKIAIPDLEVGDILDYYEVLQTSFSRPVSLIETTSDIFPVINNTFIFDISESLNFVYGTFNGASSIKTVSENGRNINGNSSKFIKRFSITDNNLPAIKNERWATDYLNEPTYKLMVTKSKSLLGKGEKVFKGNKFEKFPLENVAISTIKKYRLHVGSDIKAALDDYKFSDKFNELPINEKISTLYNKVRFVLAAYSSFYGYKGNGEIMHDLRETTVLNPNIFTTALYRELKSRNIKAYYVVTTDKRYGDLDDIRSTAEIILGLYIPETNQYLWASDYFMHAEEQDIYIAGNKALHIIKRNSEYFSLKTTKFDPVVLPESTHSTNSVKNKINIKINEDLTINFKGLRNIKGAQKSNFNRQFIHHAILLNDEDHKILKKLRPTNKNAMPLIFRPMLKSIYDEDELKSKDIEKENHKAAKNWLKSDYSFKTLDNFKILKSGRLPEHNGVQVEFEFNSDQYVWKAGPNLILDAGKLISGQVALSEDEIKNRKYPIQQNYARSFQNEIEVQLPEGYKAQGLDQLNISLDNDYAAFLSTASQSGNILRITTNKIYKKENVPVNEWNQLVEMLETAFDFSQKRVVLKKE